MTNLAAGWYPDPENSEVQRYWDGENWLDIPVPPPGNSVMQHPLSKPQMSKRSKVLLGLGAAIMVLVAASGIGWKVIMDKQAADLQAEEDQRIADEEQAEIEAEQDRIEAQALLDDAARQARKASIDGIQESVKTMAEGHIADGILTGPIIKVTCSPVGGGSTDDLDQSTTVFGCFVANQDNGDGTMSGYNYHATMNWDTGQYTYGMGKA